MKTLFKVLFVAISFLASSSCVESQDTSPIKYGYIDKTGNFVIPAHFEVAYSFYEGLANVKESGGLYGYIDRTGKWVIRPQFDYAGPFHEGLAIVGIGKKLGYIDKTGNVMIEPQFSKASTFTDGLACVATTEGGSYGYIDKTGKLIISITYQLPSYVSDGLILAINADSKKWGYIDKEGRTIINFIYDNASPFFEGRAFVQQTGQSFVIDKNGNKYNIVGGMTGGPTNYSIGFGNSGDVVYNTINSKYEFIPYITVSERFRNGYAIAQKEDKWGVVDNIGRVIVDYKYDWASTFFDGLMSLSWREESRIKSSVFNTKFEKVFEVDGGVNDYSDGVATYYVNQKGGLIDKTGKVLINPLYARVSPSHEGMVLVLNTLKNGKYGYYDNTGKKVTETKFDKATPFSEGFAMVGIKK